MRLIPLLLLMMSGCQRTEVRVVAPVRTDAVPLTCASVDASSLGRLPLSVDVGGAEVKFAEWSVPDERSTDVVGFAVQVPADVTFTVKAGNEEFISNSPRWVHPRGITGPKVRPVERITFCRKASASPAVVAAR
jgi:hypothetical protein